MMRIFALLAICSMSVIFTASPSHSIQPGERLSDPVLEARARAIGQDLRCLVCQNASIDASDADLAHDLRLLVRKRLLVGDTDAEVKSFIVARYGQYVLLKPPLEKETLVLWLGPLLFALCAALAAFLYLRRMQAASQPLPITEEEEHRVKALLAEKQTGSSL